MQITIDTQRDSQNDIKKAIRLLQSMVGESSEEPEMPTQSEGFMNMFNSEKNPEVSENANSEDDENSDDSVNIETY